MRYRQSSLMPLLRNSMSPKIGRCIQAGPNDAAGRTPSQALTGCGAFQRSSPTGGAAKGIPRKTWVPELVMLPSTTPFAVLTRGTGGAPWAAVVPSQLATTQRPRWLIGFIIRHRPLRMVRSGGRLASLLNVLDHIPEARFFRAGRNWISGGPGQTRLHRRFSS